MVTATRPGALQGVPGVPGYPQTFSDAGLGGTYFDVKQHGRSTGLGGTHFDLARQRGAACGTPLLPSDSNEISGFPQGGVPRLPVNALYARMRAYAHAFLDRARPVNRITWHSWHPPFPTSPQERLR